MFADFPIVAIAYRDNTPAHYFLFPSEAIRHFPDHFSCRKGRQVVGL